MPRGKPTRPADVVRGEQNRQWFIQTGERPTMPMLYDWDPNMPQWGQAMLEIMATGCSVMLRPGSGQKIIGIAIWEPDFRGEPTWLYTEEELNGWSEAVVARAAANRAEAAD